MLDGKNVWYLPGQLLPLQNQESEVSHLQILRLWGHKNYSPLIIALLQPVDHSPPRLCQLRMGTRESRSSRGWLEPGVDLLTPALQVDFLEIPKHRNGPE